MFILLVVNNLIEFNTCFSNATVLACRTPSLIKHRKTHLIGQELTVVIVKPDNLVRDIYLEMTEKYVYNYDPYIQGVYPLKTFLMGGLQLTVNGTNFTSVSLPKLDIIMAFRDMKNTFSSVRVND